ncbi:hypothetical protein L6164_011439 [Bauhinia variegata]|uniref:Uncharacterized protein n=1 Tax=Bauhinia variegata TaxID=167791 RepID=A0ACB9P8J1_BAUVA|nr:hypothetical protein L6164_011439 [Bauhinia variegata]
MGFRVSMLWWVLLGLLVHLESNGSFGCLEAERNALLLLKAAFNHPDGSALPSWNGEHSECCNWERVICENTSTNAKRITQLLLNNTRDFQLAIADWSLNTSYLLPFQQLQLLDLSWNYMTGFVGVIISEKLQILRLNGNKLTQVPSFGALPSLKVLDLSFTGLTNFRFLSELSTMTKLEVLDLGNNLLTGTLSDAIGNLTFLKALSLSANNLVGSLASEGNLCKLKSLQELDLSRNQFLGNLPSCLINLTSLRVFDIANNGFEGIFPSLLLSSLKSLAYISLSYNYFHGSFPFASLTNHSNLEVFDLLSSNSRLKVETETLPFIPPFQLKVFRLSNCIVNEPTKVIPSFLLYQSELRIVDLSYNSITAKFPQFLLKNNTRLEYLSLSNNFFTGPFELNSTLKYPHMNFLDISHNPIKGKVPSCIGSVLPNLRIMNMSKAELQGVIPSSMGDMGLLMLLDFSANNFSGELPEELVMGGNSLEFLKLSNNHLNGTISSAKSNLGALKILRLDNNHFTGSISTVFFNSSPLTVLDLSNNDLNGNLPTWIGNFQRLSSLVLSRNSLQGPLPLDFCKLNRLTYIDLSKNHLNGTLPSCFDMKSLRYLHLQGNQFSGPIPYVLTNSSVLLTLDLMNNKFSGEIPSWIGSFAKLRVLLLKGNTLQGPIPVDICQLKRISILDLSHNNLSGGIPSCLNVVSPGLLEPLDGAILGEYFIMVPVKFTRLSFQSLIYLYDGINMQVLVSDEEQEVEFMSKSRFESYKGNILYYMSGIDLSCNMFTGSIPPQIGYLSSIHTLNLSNNQLSGSIPETFSNLRQIESLDLSYNRLNGRIPPQLVELYSLSVFFVVHNNLSGSTPERKFQFATFGQSSYEGNPFLCGPPLERSCISDGEASRTMKASDGKRDEFISTFFWSFGASFVVAFLGVIAFLHFNFDSRKFYIRKQPTTQPNQAHIRSNFLCLVAYQSPFPSLLASSSLSAQFRFRKICDREGEKMSGGGTQKSLRKALGALKDTATVSLAKVNNDYKELDIAIVKATNHVERPAKERHIRAVYSAISATRPRADVAYCIHALARRLSKTHNWAVALKTLIVIHRALREVDPTFHEEFINYGKTRSHMLNMAHFKDDSSPNAWDYSAWIRAYALFLEERLECFRVLKYDVEIDRPRTKDLDTAELLEQLPALQQLLFRVLNCQPHGAAVNNIVIHLALSMVALESIKIYQAINDGTVNMIDKFFEMQRHDAMKALEIYRRAGQQAERLSEFYEMCRNLDIGRGEKFLKIEQPPASFLQAMEEYVKEAPRVSTVRKDQAVDNKSSPPKEVLSIEYKKSPEAKEERPESPAPPPAPEPVKVEAPAAQPPPDLLNLDDTVPAASELEEKNALALAIVPVDQPTPAVTNQANGTTGWELALVTSPSSNESATAASKLAGGLDKLTLDSLYDDAIRRRNQNVSYNPWEPAPAGALMPQTMHDPFYASNAMAAPPSVQMAAMSNQQQAFMLQQQQQQMMMMGHQQPSVNPFGNPYGATVYPYGSGMPVQAYNNPYKGFI